MTSLRLVFILLVVALSVSAGRAQVTGGVLGEKGAPFSADVIEEGDAIRDGKKVRHVIHGKIYRDAEGRTRVEMEKTLSGGDYGEAKTWIFDPVRHTWSVLTPATKKAAVSMSKVKYGTGDQPGPAPSPEPSVDASAKQEDGTKKSETLGPRTIEGFEATGTRTVWTWEPGRLVNGKPITNISEVWYSSQLKTVLLISNGDSIVSSTWRLTNIHQGDPDPALFQIPADYAVQEVEQP